MICDGTKVVALRAMHFFTQEQLAAKAKVDRRTIQRLEAGEPVSLETLHQVAAPLQTAVHELLCDQDEPADGAGIVLKPERSGLRLVEAICEAHRLDFGAAFEPWPEQVEAVGPFLGFLEQLNPFTFDNYLEYDRSLCQASGRMMAAAKVNAGIERLASLRPSGLHVLFGQYNVMDLRWRVAEEGCWTTGRNQREEVLTVAVLRIAPVSTINLRIPIRGKPVPPLPAPVANDLEYKDIPF
jgi:transcriptional regulator with XRE-family HTH domain